MDNSANNLKTEKQKIGTWGHLVKARKNMVLRYAGKKILDAGCSSGAYVQYLCERCYDAYGFDLLLDEKWQGKYKLRFKIADIRQIPYKDNSFDTVIAFEVLEHLDNVELALRELYRVTSDNIIISVPNCSQPKCFQKSGLAFHHWVDRTHKQSFTETTLKEHLKKCGFTVDVEEYINPIVPDILFLSSWHFSLKMASFIGRFLNRIPIRKKYYMTILMVASKNKRGEVK